MLRDILNNAMRQKDPLTDEQEETLNALHEKICLYWMNEAEDKDPFEELEESARFWADALKTAGLTD